MTHRRMFALSLWTAAFAISAVFLGVPTSDPFLLLGWLWMATIAWNSHLPWRSHLAFVRDWAPVLLILLVYNISRGYADGLSAPHAIELVRADQWLFGWLLGGDVPTVWLQRHLWQPGSVQWWEVAVSLIYFSHFLAVPAAAVMLWVRSRQRWKRYMWRWIVLTLAGLATYFAYPAAPPWWAAQPQHGSLIAPVERISTNGWEALGLHSAGNALNAMQVEASNPVAAMPSLHTAYALLVIAFFLPTVQRRWWPLLLAYPLAMAFTLVYTAEHYVIDILAGWTYVGVTFIVVGRVERWTRSRDEGEAEQGRPAMPAAPVRQQ
ncbi:phosphatase PAP2 family protein [Salinispora mooreana]|uniref:phosphatase PAP2 family protein n=1 Tax=Salinispora mooreana TaxID=999545 RepID=UPI0004760BE3